MLGLAPRLGLGASLGLRVTEQQGQLDLLFGKSMEGSSKADVVVITSFTVNREDLEALPVGAVAYRFRIAFGEVVEDHANILVFAVLRVELCHASLFPRDGLVNASCCPLVRGNAVDALIHVYTALPLEEKMTKSKNKIHASS